MGLVPWGAHVQTVTWRGGLCLTLDAHPCPACTSPVGPGLSACPSHCLFLLSANSQLIYRLQFCSADTEGRVLVLYKDSRFVISIRSPEWASPHPQGGVWTVYTGPMGVLHMGDRNLGCKYAVPTVPAALAVYY